MPVDSDQPDAPDLSGPNKSARLLMRRERGSQPNSATAETGAKGTQTYAKLNGTFSLRNSLVSALYSFH
jgi:hypothetical protein